MKALLSSGFKLPNRNRTILLSLSTEEAKLEFVESAKLLEQMNYKLYASEGTAAVLSDHGVKVDVLRLLKGKNANVKKSKHPLAMDYLANGKIDLLINVSEVCTHKVCM